MGLYAYNLLTFILVILFVLGFVSIVMWFKKKEGERKTKVLLSALEKGQTISPELFSSGKQLESRNKYILLALLIGGIAVSLFAVIITPVVIIDEVSRCTINYEGTIVSAVLIAIGTALLLGYFKGKKMLRPEIESEDNCHE